MMMNDEQFQALAQLLRLRGGASQEAGRLVMVEGLTGAEAALRCGVTPQSVSQVVAACRRGLALARKAVGNQAPAQCREDVSAS